MRYLAALCFLPFAPAALAQQAPASREQAQQMIAAALNDATFPVYNSNPAATGWYKGKASDPCLTRYQLFMPPHVAAGVAKPSRTYEFGVNWSEVKSAVPEPSDLGRIRVTRISATEWFTLAGDRQVRFLTAADYLITACKPAAAAPKPQPNAAAPASAASPRVIAEWLATRSLPRGWTVTYSGLEAGVHVFVYTGDLRTNPDSWTVDGMTYLDRDICGDPALKARVAGGMRMRADTTFVSTSSSTIRGIELRCPGAAPQAAAPAAASPRLEAQRALFAELRPARLQIRGDYGPIPGATGSYTGTPADSCVMTYGTTFLAYTYKGKPVAASATSSRLDWSQVDDIQDVTIGTPTVRIFTVQKGLSTFQPASASTFYKAAAAMMRLCTGKSPRP